MINQAARTVLLVAAACWAGPALADVAPPYCASEGASCEDYGGVRGTCVMGDVFVKGKPLEKPTAYEFWEWNKTRGLVCTVTPEALAADAAFHERYAFYFAHEEGVWMAGVGLVAVAFVVARVRRSRRAKLDAEKP